MKKFSVVYQNKTPQRIDKFLAQQIAKLNRSDVKRLIKNARLKVNGEVVEKVSYNLSYGDKLIFLYEVPDLLSPDHKKRIEVKYEDDDLLIVEKPAGLPVYSTSRRNQSALINVLLSRYPELKKVGQPERPGIVHRLDKQTSGLIIVARTVEAYEYLKNLFAQRKIEKEYQALVFGKAKAKGRIEKHLTKIGQQGRSKVRVDKAGKSALTEYVLIDLYQDPNRLDFYSLVKVKLHTGRTHQIRVHFASLARPVMGDTLYGKPDSQKLKQILPRQFLHASRLGLKLLNGTWLDVESKLPEDLTKVLKYLKYVRS